MWYAVNSEISNTHITFGFEKRQTHYKIATNQSLNLSPRVSTRGLFLKTYKSSAVFTNPFHHYFNM